MCPERLDAVRITLSAYTASFRVPGFIGHQLTLPVPPLSTIYGLLSAAAGRWVEPHEVAWFAYRCDYVSKASDLEVIIQVERKGIEKPPYVRSPPETRNVLQREFLFMPRLTLYLPSEWEKAFRTPRYALLLGRTQDVAYVESIVRTSLEPVEEGEVSGVLLPFELILKNRGKVQAWLQNLPIAFTNEPHRRPLGMRIFGVVDAKTRSATVRAPGWLVRDPDGEVFVPLYRREWVENVLRRAAGEVGGAAAHAR